MKVAPVAGPLDAVVRVPGSKSLTNRALLCAGLAPGESVIEGALVADDTEAMAACLRTLGASVDPALRVVRGGELRPGPARLDARLSGTTARFLLPVLATGVGEYTLDGAAPLRARPMGDLVDAVRSLGATVSGSTLPLTVTGGGRGGRALVPGGVSSQFVSALLLAGPRFPRGVEVELTTELVSAPYVRMTAAVMAAFGVTVDGLRVGPGTYVPAAFAVEPDASAASYFFAAAALCGGSVTVAGLTRRSGQGDVAVLDVLAAMGAQVDDTTEGIRVRGTGAVRGGEFDLRHMPDMAQTVAVVAAVADGPTRVTGVGFIRGHETDRIAAVVRELHRCGVDADEEPDGFVVRPTGAVHGARVETYDDHRMAMSFAVLGLRVAGMEIAEPGCVAKTFPGFWDALDRLRSSP